MVHENQQAHNSIGISPQLAPSACQQLPGRDGDPTGLVEHENHSVGDAFATDELAWVPNCAAPRRSKLVDYDAIATWLETHFPMASDSDALVVSTDACPLSEISAWRQTPSGSGAIALHARGPRVNVGMAFLSR